MKKNVFIILIAFLFVGCGVRNTYSFGFSLDNNESSIESSFAVSTDDSIGSNTSHSE